MDSAVLFLIFNRPDTTHRVFQAIRAAAPPRLYVAADGPRSDSNQKADQELCKLARSIATAVDWPCEIQTLFRSENLGCRVAVSTAIDWFFEHEDEGIILEDDCLPDSSWFPFADEMLLRFRDDTRIMCISASHFHGKNHRPPHSYFFSRYNHCWGWASWRRAWKHYDKDMKAWPLLRNTEWLRTIGMGSRLFNHYWLQTFDKAHEGNKVDSWAYRWTFSCWSHGGLTVLPARNLVVNIGFGSDATHTKGRTTTVDTQQLECIDFPLRHPTTLAQDIWADKWTDRHVFGISLIELARRDLEKVPFVHNFMTSLSPILRPFRKGR